VFFSPTDLKKRRCTPGLAITLTLAIAVFVQPVAAKDDTLENWSGKPPPKGWTKDPYSPKNRAPKYGDEFNPDGTKATGSGDEPPPPYDPWADSRHPLKDPGGPPRDWIFEQTEVDENGDGLPDRNLEGEIIKKDREVPVDKDGDGVQDVDADGKPVTRKVGAKPADGSPGVGTASADLDWGERYYGAQFEQPVIITNKCTTVQPVTITVNNLPYLTLPQKVILPPGETTIKGTVTLPPEPSPPINVGMPGAPGWGHVDFGPIFIPPGQWPPPKLHQPHFVQIDGSFETWHPWAPADPGCNAKLTTFTVTGHIHFRPPPPPGDDGPQRLATPDVCEVYWNIGEPPAQLKDEDCTEKMRELASRFREKLLPPYIVNAPDQWLWLPSVDDIREMSIPQMLGMKAHAEAVMGTPGADASPAAAAPPLSGGVAGKSAGGSLGAPAGGRGLDKSIQSSSSTMPKDAAGGKKIVPAPGAVAPRGEMDTRGIIRKSVPQ